jgi:hypothetical protein
MRPCWDGWELGGLAWGFFDGNGGEEIDGTNTLCLVFFGLR